MVEKSNRVEWIDALKGYAIFCVTLGHLGCNFLLEKHIYSFHMFLFFFLSGFVDKTENISFKEYLLKRGKRILIPFISWNILSNLVSLLMGNSVNEVIETFFLLNGEICWNAPIWFLLTIFLTQVFYFILKRILKISDLIIICASLTLWMIIPQKNVIFKLNLIPMSMLFYVIGILYKKKSQNIAQWIFANKHLLLKYAIILIFAFINIYFGVLNNVRIVYTKAVFGNVIQTIIAGISGIFFYIMLFQNFVFLGKNRILNYLGKNSLVIMASQFYFFNLYDYVANFNIHLYRNTVKAFIMCIVTIVFIGLFLKALTYMRKKCKVVDKVVVWFGI